MMGWNHILAVYNKTPDVSHVALCVLMVLAKSADDGGYCHPSTSYIAEKAKLSLRSVNNGLGELRAGGYVSYASGRGNRHVNIYHLTEKVINISTNANVVRISNANDVRISDGQMRTTCVLNAQDVRIKCAPRAQGSIHKTTKEVSVSLSPHPAGHAASAEVLLAKPGTKSAELPPSAAGNDAAAYRKLVKQYGWKPKGRKDLEAAVDYCYSLGASLEVAKSFARYNSIRRWKAVCDTVSVHMLAKEWVRIWQYKTPDEFAAERTRRAEAKRKADEARQAAIVRAEREAEKAKGV